MHQPNSSQKKMNSILSSPVRLIVYLQMCQLNTLPKTSLYGSVVMMSLVLRRGIRWFRPCITMVLPGGRTPVEAGFTFITEAHSPETERVWRALARRGLATNVGESHWGGNSYIWNSYDDLDMHTKQS